jgi:hypothetical protein
MDMLPFVFMESVFDLMCTDCFIYNFYYDQQHNGQKKKDKMINNVLQNITQKTKDQVTLTPLITGGELMFSGRISWS